MAISPAYSLTVPRYNKSELHPRAIRYPDLPVDGHESKHRITNKLHRLGDIGSILLLGTSSFTLLTPFLPNILKKRLSQATLQKMQVNRILRQVLDKDKALKLSLRLAGIPGLLMYMYNLEIALNTQQPTKVATTLVSIIQAVLSFLIPTSLFQRGFITISAGLWSAGERNDIENSLHPNQRRELDVRKYFSKKSKAEQGKAVHEPVTVSSIFNYIKKDLKYATSFNPWKEMSQKSPEELLSSQPASYQSAISCQLFLLTTFLIWTAWILQHKKLPPEKSISSLQKIAQGTTLFGTVFGVLPLWMRAWQMRDQTDSKLMLLGGPVMTLGKSLTFSNKYLSLSGFNGLGGSFWSRGLASNSRKYDTMLDYLKNLYIESSQHPTLTAGDLLRYLYEPENINMLQHNVGKTRSRFILQTLLQAQQAYKHDKTPLATFLAPVIHSHNNELRYTHSNLMDDESYTSPSSW